ncbi:MAG: D-alanyl-D-alanine carboxypeptidase family protein [Anaerovoracaceae bacterium]|jgi:D-alanyl-D-alanine carboxypeptidase (penicillin-binding protein 5/6)
MKIKKQRAAIFLLLLFLLIGFPVPVWSETESESESEMEFPEISAQSAIVMEMNSGKILYEKNGKQKVYPASTTKILTALLAIENGYLDEKIKVPSEASGVEGSSIFLETGEKISLRDLVYGLMLRSGNDAAIAISGVIAKSPEQFVKLMNKRAKEIGANDTNFVNPNGLFDKNHYTTAYDMALIAREAMKNPQFKKVVGSKSWKADRGEGKYNHFYNKNKVIFEYPGGSGIKIGYTKASGRTLVASSERDGMELICVVMNAPNWFQDSYKLMDYIYENYKVVKVASAHRILKTVFVKKGDKDFVLVGPKEDILCPVPKEEDCSISLRYVLPDKVKAPISRWQEAGLLQLFIDGECVCAQSLYYLEDIDNIY